MKEGSLTERLVRQISGLAEDLLRDDEGQGWALPLSALVPSPHQPRKRLEGLEDLAASIREKGVLQPLLVRPLGEGRYEIVAGERRFRAAKMAGLSEVPVVVLDLSPEEARAVALIENLKREDLNPYEETVALLDLLALRLGTDREGAASLLHRLRNVERGKVTQKPEGRPGGGGHPLHRRLGAQEGEGRWGAEGPPGGGQGGALLKGPQGQGAGGP